MLMREALGPCISFIGRGEFNHFTHVLKMVEGERKWPLNYKDEEQVMGTPSFRHGERDIIPP